MFIPFKKPEVNQFIRLHIDISNQQGVFKAPHNFRCIYSNEEVCQLTDIDGHNVFGVPHVDIRNHFEVISTCDFDNGVTV